MLQNMNTTKFESKYVPVYKGLWSHLFVADSRNTNVLAI